MHTLSLPIRPFCFYQEEKEIPNNELFSTNGGHILTNLPIFELQSMENRLNRGLFCFSPSTCSPHTHRHTHPQSSFKLMGRMPMICGHFLHMS
ncbi:hypothetical protein GOP47_0018712 [Adiantum capillus-veneris]|uniref:Uncharacterized protein n=1 Tax=Adiantum capillus-veneris TaxID=13818 RepID=A0A9D4UDQ0_ADICA|nr:hypothetical protein GOP47_0018712 [Adiantum capillus-veneris]